MSKKKKRQKTRAAPLTEAEQRRQQVIDRIVNGTTMTWLTDAVADAE